jgi:two-component system, OmpR family, sensor histidine kinase VicK
MNPDIFEQHLVLCRKRLEELWQRAEKLPALPNNFWRQTSEIPQRQQDLLHESLEELSNSIEELHVATEELRQQGEELANSRIAIEAERQRYQELLEFAPYGYLVTTKEGAIREANQMAAQLFNISPNRLVGKPLTVFVTAETRQSFYQKLSLLQKGESINNWHLQFQRRHQVSFRASCNAAPIHDWQGQVVGLRWCILDLNLLLEAEMGKGGELLNSKLVQKINHHPNINGNLEAIVTTANDISKQKQLAATTTALARETELSVLKSHFASVISHELRNPLNNIVYCAKLVETHSQSWSEEKQRHYLQQIQVNVKQIDRRLDDLLVLGNIEAGQQQLNLALIDLTEFCRELIQKLQQDAGRKHKITFISQGSRSGVWDAKLLRHLLVNLLLNAMKYSPEGSEVKLTVACQNGQVMFSIQDSGLGIPQDEMELIFQPFQRGSNVRKILGSGLGLAIAKRCVDLHRGEISVDSQVGVGTTVTVTLPLNLRVMRG